MIWEWMLWGAVICALFDVSATLSNAIRVWKTTDHTLAQMMRPTLTATVLVAVAVLPCGAALGAVAWCITWPLRLLF